MGDPSRETDIEMQKGWYTGNDKEERRERPQLIVVGSRTDFEGESQGEPLAGDDILQSSPWPSCAVYHGPAYKAPPFSPAPQAQSPIPLSAFPPFRFRARSRVSIVQERQRQLQKLREERERQQAEIDEDAQMTMQRYAEMVEMEKRLTEELERKKYEQVSSAATRHTCSNDLAFRSFSREDN
eukprot:3377613-Pleurochrysis_carterae.AAC.2